MKPSDRYRVRLAWLGAGGLTALLLAGWQPPALQRVDLLAHDLLLGQRQPVRPAPVVLAIDDASLSELGRWPWPRRLQAEVIERLRQAGAGPIGVALLFTEPDLQDPEGDALLAQAVRHHGHTVLAVAPTQLPDGSLGLSTLMPAFAAAAADGALPLRGHVDVEIDLDGQSRSLFLRAGSGQADVPALALAVLELAQTTREEAGPKPVETPSARGRWVRSQEVLLPRQPMPVAVPMHRALKDPQWLADQVRGRTVFIGLTARGLGAELASPLAASHATLPAVMVHAMAYQALQDQAWNRRAPPVCALLLALACLAVMGLKHLPHRRRNTLVMVGVSAGLLLLPLLAAGLLLQLAHWWVGPSLAMLSLGVALASAALLRLRRVTYALLRSREHAHTTLQAIDDAVITVDPDSHTVRFANPAAQRQGGPQALPGHPLRLAYPLTESSQRDLAQAIGQCMDGDAPVHVPALLDLQGAQGNRTLRATASPLHSPDGKVDGAVLVFSDVTDNLAAALAHEHAATHDALTGLPNRRMLHERMALMLSRIQRRGGTAAVFFLDLDRFKHINDSLGHRIGDEVLKVLAQRLRTLCRDTDTVARWGGDEFVLLLEDIGGHDGAAAAAAKIVEALRQDIELGAEFQHQRLPSAGSVGVVLVPQDGEDIEGLLSRADMAMYRAKQQPKGSYHFWSEDINTRVQDRLALELELRQALSGGQLLLHFQPQFAMHNTRMVGLEALMRWQREPGDCVLPGLFIPVAEESGLIVDMGAWALLQAARQIAAWRAAGLPPLPIAVNVSARQCQNRDIVQVLRAALRETGIPPALLRLEITESTAMADVDHVIGLLHDIRSLGVELAVDDFGTGYSSLTYLKRFPINELKVDRSFVNDIAHDRNDAAIVGATIALAHGLGLKVVAEGVETPEQSRALIDRGCDTAQGYLYGRPQPIQDIERLLHQLG